MCTPIHSLWMHLSSLSIFIFLLSLILPRSTCYFSHSLSILSLSLTPHKQTGEDIQRERERDSCCCPSLPLCRGDVSLHGTSGINHINVKPCTNLQIDFFVAISLLFKQTKHQGPFQSTHDTLLNLAVMAEPWDWKAVVGRGSALLFCHVASVWHGS